MYWVSTPKFTSPRAFQGQPANSRPSLTDSLSQSQEGTWRLAYYLTGFHFFPLHYIYGSPDVPIHCKWQGFIRSAQVMEAIRETPLSYKHLWPPGTIKRKCDVWAHTRAHTLARMHSSNTNVAMGRNVQKGTRLKTACFPNNNTWLPTGWCEI